MDTDRYVVRFNRVFESRRSPIPTPPTKESLGLIRAELGIRIPLLMATLAKHCPAFTSVFAGLGTNIGGWGHILAVNRRWHEPQGPLPKHLVSFTQGHDCELTCWDLSQPKLNGEYPIVHASFDDGVESFVLSPFGDSFEEHLNSILKQAF